jgi:hypothetical protein
LPVLEPAKTAKVRRISVVSPISSRQRSGTGVADFTLPYSTTMLCSCQMERLK